MQYWILKTEPNTWSWNDQLAKGVEPWNGVRNFQARNNINSMHIGDIAFFYHTGNERKIVGLVKICSNAYLDEDPNFVVVDVKTIKSVTKDVSLKDIKNEQSLQQIQLIKQSRLSVVPISEEEFNIILKMSETLL